MHLSINIYSNNKTGVWYSLSVFDCSTWWQYFCSILWVIPQYSIFPLQIVFSTFLWWRFSAFSFTSIGFAGFNSSIFHPCIILCVLFLLEVMVLLFSRSGILRDKRGFEVWHMHTIVTLMVTLLNTRFSMSSCHIFILYRCQFFFTKALNVKLLLWKRKYLVLFCLIFNFECIVFVEPL